MNYKGVIFDLDGTLLDTLGDISGAVSYALSRFSFPPIDREGVRARIGDGAYKLMERCFPQGTEGAVINEALLYFRDYYRAHPVVTTKPYDGIRELVEGLKADGVPMAVASNKDDFLVKELMERYFPGVFLAACGVSETCRRKPSPDIPNAALSALGLRAEQVILVGDSLTDKQTAEACGMGFLYVPWGYGYPEKIMPALRAKNIDDAGKIIRAVLDFPPRISYNVN